MTNSLINGKTFEEIINQPYAMVTSLWLSSNSTSILDIDQIIQIIDVFSQSKIEHNDIYSDNFKKLIQNLILFHINKMTEYEFKKYSALILKLIKLYEQNSELFCSTINLYSKKVLLAISDLKIIKSKEESIALINAASKFITTSYWFANFIKKYVDMFDDFTNDDILHIYTRWRFSHLNDRNNSLDILNMIEVISGITYTVYPQDCIIAYKGINDDNTSVMASSCSYEVDKVYTEVSDNDFYNENSFGLSVWDLKHALEYGKTILMCRIKFKDITYFNFLDGRIRCSEFEVINIKKY